MPTISLNNKPVYYKEWGSGPVILMLHGWPADSSHYEKLGPILRDKGYRVIVPDLPGWGKTEAPDTAWTVSDYRDWIDQFVKELKLDDFVLFGHSFGGRIAIKYAIQYPYKLKALILCAAAGVKPDPLTLKRKALKMTAAVGKKAFSLPLINRFADIARKLLYRAAGSDDYIKVQGVMKETIVKVLEEDLSPLIPQISQKTLLLWGEEDGATPLTDGQKMNQEIKLSTMVSFPDTKHNLPKLIPDQLATEINKFIKQDDLDVIGK